MVIYQSLINGENRLLEIHFIVFTFCLFVAISSKFSNLILLPITIGTCTVIGFKLFKKKNISGLQSLFPKLLAIAEKNKNEIKMINKLKITHYFQGYSKLLMESLGIQPVEKM